MKRIFALITALILALTLSACGTESVNSVESIVESSKTEESQAAVSSQKPKKDTATQTKQDSANKHTHKYTAKKTPATCKEKGYTTYTCSCGASYVKDYVEGKHEYVNNKCKYCGKANVDGLYEHLKSWVLENGTVNGDYVYYGKSSDTYGGKAYENFSLTYWNDTGRLEFCLHCPINDTYSHSFYILIPKTHNGNYEYCSSYYYRDNGESKYESNGVIEAAAFTDNYPLKSTSYYGAADYQNTFLEESRIGICDSLRCLSQFLEKEKLGYTLSDLGFAKFS